MRLTSRVAAEISVCAVQIRYTAEDAAANKATPTLRLVHVMCPPGERTCQSEALPTTLYCSEAQLCIEPRPSQRPGAKVTTTIQLLGPSTVYLEQGSVYAVCPDPRPLSLVCDRGASGSQPQEGRLDVYVTACDPKSRFVKYGLQACSLDTRTPGAPRCLLGCVQDNVALAGHVGFAAPHSTGSQQRSRQSRVSQVCNAA